MPEYTHTLTQGKKTTIVNVPEGKSVDDFWPGMYYRFYARHTWTVVQTLPGDNKLILERTARPAPKPKSKRQRNRQSCHARKGSQMSQRGCWR